MAAVATVGTAYESLQPHMLLLSGHIQSSPHNMWMIIDWDVTSLQVAYNSMAAVLSRDAKN